MTDLEQTTFDTEPTRCPHCGHSLDRLASVGHAQPPAVGDFTVCFYCTALMTFVEPLPSMRLANKADIDKIDIGTARYLLDTCQRIEQVMWLRERVN